MMEYKPEVYRIDSKCKTSLHNIMKEKGIYFQLVPTHIHRRNLAERSIRVFKENFIVGVTYIDQRFLMNIWYTILNQATMTLNMMRSSRVHPNLSAYNEMHRALNFSKTPLEPIRIKVLVCEKESVRQSWVIHRIYG